MNELLARIVLHGFECGDGRFDLIRIVRIAGGDHATRQSVSVCRAGQGEGWHDAYVGHVRRRREAARHSRICAGTERAHL